MALRRPFETSFPAIVAIAIAALLVPQAAASQTYERLASFVPHGHGDVAKSPVIQGPDGSFYGTASLGGTHGQGTVFKIDPDGVWSTLHSFDGTEGSVPLGGLLLASDGNLYGTTNNVGGSIFRCGLNGGCTTLHRFTTIESGSNAVGELIEATDGHLYGVTSQGGTANAGTIFRITLNGTFTMLQSLPGGTGPLRPMAGLIQAADGAFYGTTRLGGINGVGTIYKMDAAGLVTTFFSFNGTNHGSQPLGRLIQTADGSFLGTASAGGNFGFGTIFRVSSLGSYLGGTHFSFQNGPRAPNAGLTLGPDGNYYGTTRLGGHCCISGPTAGTVIRVTPTGGLSGYASLLLTGGSHPYAPLLLASDGLLYGTTSGLIDNNSPGTFFKVDTSIIITTLSDFPRTGGANPWGVALGPPGVVVGLTPFGGTDNKGVVYRWDETLGLMTAYEFESPDQGVGLPLARESDGLLYGAGATIVDGESGGWLSRFDATGTPVRLHTFTAAEGGYPEGFTLASDGNIYGTNNGHPVNGGGTLFRLDPLGNLTTLHTFGVDEYVSVIIQGPDGNLYGFIYDAPNVARLYRADLSGLVTTVHTFTGPDGERPTFLMRGPGSLLYGTTLLGGTHGDGTIFSFDVTTGTLGTLHHFDGVEGRAPERITVTSGGDLYVHTEAALGTGYGGLFKFTANWSIEWVLAGTVSDRLSNVVEGPDGNLYGAAGQGGSANAGAIFRIRLQSATTTTLESSLNPSTFGAQITLDATVDGESSEPTGLVEFFDGALSLGTASLTAGVATLSIDTLDVGTHNLTAQYLGTPLFESSTSDVLMQTVDRATPIVSWADPAPIEYGTPLSATQLNATANVPGTFGYTPASGTILTVGTHVLSVEFTPTDTGRYTNASTTATLTVNPAPPLLVAVTMPNGGDTLHQLSPYTLTWTASGGAGGISRFDVAVSTNNGSSYTPIAACSALSGAARSCVWNAPGPTTTKGRIKVTATDGVGGTQFDVSDAAFKIATGAATLTVSSPNTAVNWGIGSHQTITWSHKGGAAARFRIELSRNGGATYGELIADNVVANTATAGSYVWEVTAPATATARVRVTAVNVPSATDVSNANFTIAAPFVAVSAPKANANWGYGSDQEVTWTTNLGAADLLAVELSTDGGTSWPTTLGADLSPTLKKTPVTTPVLGAPTATARIRLVWTNAPPGVVLSASNPGNFKIEPPFVTVKAPNGGEAWNVGALVTISWNSNLGKLENLRIELSTDGGSTFPIEVLATTPADGSQKVTVLAGWVTPTAKIRLSWTENAAVADTSNAIFGIQ